MTRIARFRTQEGTVLYGVLKNDDLLQPIDGSPFGQWQVTSEVLAVAQVRLLAPASPPNIIGVGLNYRSHAAETGMPVPQAPVLFLKATTAVCGPDDEIVLPRLAPSEVDYECELAIVMGKTAKNVEVDEALDYVLGYTCGNDVTARDCQLRLDVQWARGKSFDSFAPLGPWIETDLDPDQADIRTRLNGKIVQDSSTSDMIFSCRELISHISQCMTLLPGTVIMTGTPGGVGLSRRPQVFLRRGDEVEIEIEGIGRLRNRVVSEQ